MKKSFLLPNKGKKDTVAERKRYPEMTGSIIFSIVETSPDIIYVTLMVSYFAKNLLHLHSKIVKTIFCYQKATIDVAIAYVGKKGGDIKIKGYFDSNWANNYITRKSILGFIFMLNNRPISCYSK